MKKYAPLVLAALLLVGIAGVVIYAEKLSQEARASANEAMARGIEITSLKMEISRLKTEAASKEKTIESNDALITKLVAHRDALQRAFDAANEYIAVIKPMAEKYASGEKKAQAEAARKERIRQQNLAAQRQQREAALQFAAQQRAEQADTASAQSDMAATAQSAAEAYFRNDYRPGGNSSVLVMEVSATISTVEQVPGWSGRWRARGRASIGYYVSSGGSFSRESHDFEVELGNGSPKVEVRS